MHYRYFLKFITLFLILAVVTYLPYKVISAINTKNKIIKKREILPVFNFITLQGEWYNLHNRKSDHLSVIIYFNSDCHHCIYEIESIINHIDSFKNTSIILVSDQPFEKLRQFSSQYKLGDYSRIKLLYTNCHDFISAFGTATVPTTYIYDENNRLLRLFKGEAGVEAILNVINNR